MAADPHSPAPGRAILLVDDEGFTRKVLERMLRNQGWTEVVEAETGRQALDVVAARGPDLAAIISDFDMPDINGLHLLQTIRVGAAGKRRDLPVLMLTARADRGMVGIAMALDCDAFLIKPTTAEQVRDRLARVLSDDRHLRPAAEYAAVTLPQDRPQAPAPAAAATGMLIPLEEAREGMVLAADLMAAGGEVLLAAGNVLTRKVLATLGDLDAGGDRFHRLLVVG